MNKTEQCSDVMHSDSNAFRSAVHALVQSAYSNYLSTFLVHDLEHEAPGHVTEYSYDVISLPSDFMRARVAETAGATL